MPLLSARDLGRRGDDGGWLLRDVTVRLDAGERLAVHGPSGSGKTLLLRSLALLDEPDAGEVLWRGEPIADAEVPAFRRRVVYLHQRPRLVDGSVERNLRLAGDLAQNGDLDFDRARLVEICGRLGRDQSFLVAAARDLSGGESQLVAAARALLNEPDVLLLDEPTASLDARARTLLEDLVGDWLEARPEARALVWVSHDESQARRVAGRDLELRGGRAVSDAGRS